jgi:hypothetical protein
MLSDVMLSHRFVSIVLFLGICIIVLIWFVLPIISVFPQINDIQKIEITLVVLTAYIVLILDFVAKLTRPTNLVVTKSDPLWNAWVTPLLEKATPKTAYFIEYSSVNARPIVDLLLEHRWNVKMLLRNPNLLDDARQEGKIKAACQGIKKELAAKNITVLFYSTPGSIRLRYIEGTIVSLGWYTYDHRNEDEPKQIWGHSNIMISALPTCKEWNDMQKFAIDLFERMERDTTNLQDTQ